MAIRTSQRLSFKRWHLTKLWSWFIQEITFIMPTKLRKIFPKFWLIYFLLNGCIVQEFFKNINFSFSQYPVTKLKTLSEQKKSNNRPSFVTITLIFLFCEYNGSSMSINSSDTEMNSLSCVLKISSLTSLARKSE